MGIKGLDELVQSLAISEFFGIFHSDLLTVYFEQLLVPSNGLLLLLLNHEMPEDSLNEEEENHQVECVLLNLLQAQVPDEQYPDQSQTQDELKLGVDMQEEQESLDFPFNSTVPHQEVDQVQDVRHLESRDLDQARAQGENNQAVEQEEYFFNFQRRVCDLEELFSVFVDERLLCLVVEK